MIWDYFAVMVVIALPAAVLYPIVYALNSRWWKTSIGVALLVKATGLAIMLAFTAALLVLGPDYPGRTTIKNVGITLIAVGVWAAFLAMLREYHLRPAQPKRRATDR